MSSEAPFDIDKLTPEDREAILRSAKGKLSHEEMQVVVDGGVRKFLLSLGTGAKVGFLQGLEADLEAEEKERGKRDRRKKGGK